MQSRAKALSYSKAIAEIFYLSFSKHSPADRELKSYFRRQTECGSKDRHFISEATYSLFRWYGWLGKRLPKIKPENPLESKKFCLALSAALWLDQHEISDISQEFFRAAEVNSEIIGIAPDDIASKKKGLACFFKFQKLDICQLVPSWLPKELPEEVELTEIISSFLRRPPVWLRLQNNPNESILNELNEHNLNPQRHPKVTNAVKIGSTKFNVNAIKAYQKGYFEIQDLASQCLGLVCQAAPGETWWDVCAGGGGKTLLLADQMKGKGSIIATDKREWILKEVQTRMKRSCFKNIKTMLLENVLSDQNTFDGVLVDAPCSSTGTWRRNPDARWTAQADICKKFSNTQKEILTFSAEKVKSDGVLVYATCSLSIQENEHIVEWFLKQFPNFKLEKFHHPLTDKLSDGMMRINFMPNDCDAMFTARFRRKEKAFIQ